MEQEEIQKLGIELRSEKVRSIIGEIPPKLTHYGIIIISIVLVVITIIAFYFPYKVVYTGSATIYDIPKTKKDSVDVFVMLHFDGKRVKNDGAKPSIELYPSQTKVQGVLLHLSTQRDTLDRQQAIICFATNDILPFQEQTINFRIIESSGNMLQRLIGLN